MDYSRQMNLLDPSFYMGQKITIIGAGATGSFITMMLAQLGFGNEAENGSIIRVFDGDHVEEHNLPNQAFNMNQVGVNKATAISDLVEAKMGFAIDAHPEMVTEETDGHLITSNTVFLLTDSMSSRKMLFEKFIKGNPFIETVIETRMGLRSGMIYTFDPRDMDHIQRWEATLYEDDEAEVSACGASQTAVSTAVKIAAEAVGCWVHKALENMPNYDIDTAMKPWNEMHLTLYPNQVYYNCWSEPEGEQITNLLKLL